jgi:hypothetical protein
MTKTKGSAISVTKNVKTSKPSLMSGRRLYLAGPIRGIKDFKLRFTHATAKLRYEGWQVFNPVEQDDFFERHGTPVDVRHCLELDLGWICRWADVVALMDGWQDSWGAQTEYCAAKACGIHVWILPKEYRLD